jgi:hypothetical protein
MADPVQPSFSTLARAVGGRYDPTTPRGQELLKQDMLNEAMRAEAQRAAKAAMEERKALQYIQQESARPSRQEAPGVRSIFKDGRLVGYSTMPEAREAAEPAPQQKPMGTALEQGFISALKRADASKAARDAAEKAAEREASKTPRSRMNRDTSGVRVSGKVPQGAELRDEVGPREVIAGDVFGTGYLPMGEKNPFAAALASAFSANKAAPSQVTDVQETAVEETPAGKEELAGFREQMAKFYAPKTPTVSQSNPFSGRPFSRGPLNYKTRDILNLFAPIQNGQIGPSQHGRGSALTTWPFIDNETFRTGFKELWPSYNWQGDAQGSLWGMGGQEAMARNVRALVDAGLIRVNPETGDYQLFPQTPEERAVASLR